MRKTHAADGNAYSGFSGPNPASSGGNKKNRPGADPTDGSRVLNLLLTVAALATGESLGGSTTTVNGGPSFPKGIAGKIMMCTLGVAIVVALWVGYVVIAAIAKSW